MLQPGQWINARKCTHIYIHLCIISVSHLASSGTKNGDISCPPKKSTLEVKRTMTTKSTNKQKKHQEVRGGCGYLLCSQHLSRLWALDRSLDHRQILQFFSSTRLRHATRSPAILVGQQRPASQICGPSFWGQVLTMNPKMLGYWMALPRELRQGLEENSNFIWNKMSFCFSKSSEPHEWVPKWRMCIVCSSCQMDTKQCSDKRMEKATSIQPLYRNLKCWK